MDYGTMLRNYLTKENITAGVFAMCAQLCTNSIYSILTNKKPPGPNVSRKIYIATKGEVNFNIPYKAKKVYTEKLPVFKKRIRAPKKTKVCSSSTMG
jgi:hypothetical protein